MTPQELLKINVNDHTEKKNGLTYLSWAWAWSKVIEMDPQANYEVVMFQDPDNPNRMLPFQDMGGSHMVWVKVTVFGKTVTVQLPVLDYRNKCIPSPNAFEVNTSIMRCLTKGIAMQGLGLYIYAGEDLPMDDPQHIPKASGKTEEEVAAIADQIIQAAQAATSLTDLNRVWIGNHIDQFNDKHPELYGRIRNAFSEQKSKLTKESQNG